jgi:outer membrane PBP1 activator LpoA protein
MNALNEEQKKKSLALTEKIAQAQKKHSEAVLQIPFCDRAIQMQELDAGQQALLEKNDFTRKIKARTILDVDEIYKTLIKQKNLLEREASETQIECERLHNILKTFEILVNDSRE